jgi:glycosyltransferase involved in cell wall biosynthesis
MKKILVMPVKNEAWVLERSLATAETWADHIIVVDQQSEDGSRDICSRFKKVVVVENNSTQFNERQRRQMLLDAARNFNGNNLIVALDADEILTAQVLKDEVWQDLLRDLKPGMSVKLQWIMAWKDARHYRYDLPEWSNNYKPFIYWDDRSSYFSGGNIHLSRVPEKTADNSVRFDGFKVLHYAFAEWRRVLIKHIYYQVLEKTLGSKRHPYALNRQYRWFYKQPKNGMVIKDIPADWVEPYAHMGIPMGDFPEQKTYWYEKEILNYFYRYGPEIFKHLNIWDAEWEGVKNPQPWYDRLYYRHLEFLLDHGGPVDYLIPKRHD